MSRRGAPPNGRVIGAAVRRLRKERNWTLEQLSERTDISVPGLSEMESGKRTRVRRENIRRLAAAFDVTEDTLDPALLGERVAGEVQTDAQRRLVDAVLSLPPDLAEEATKILAELARRRRRKR